MRDDKCYLCYVRYVEEVLDLSLWKYSFDLVTRELGLAKKKKQALDNLFSADKISQSTYDYLETELIGAIAELEDHLKSIKDKMTIRAQELEKQVNTLELFLASLEIHHAAGDVDDETYGKQSNAILLGLEATKQELITIKSVSQQTVTEYAEAPPELATPPEPAEATGPPESAGPVSAKPSSLNYPQASRSRSLCLASKATRCGWAPTRRKIFGSCGKNCWNPIQLESRCLFSAWNQSYPETENPADARFLYFLVRPLSGLGFFPCRQTHPTLTT